MTDDNVLEMKGIYKQYGSVQALIDVDFSVKHNEIVGLVGSNGAGKSTLMKMIAGNFPPTKGEMWFAKTKEGELAAAEIFCFDNKRPHRWTAATSTKLRNTGAYILLLDTVFNEFKERGYSEINLMAANTPQLSEFITIFNPNLIPYYVVEKKRIKYSAIKKITSFVRKKEV